MDGGYYLLAVWAAWVWSFFMARRGSRMRRPASLITLLLVIAFPAGIPLFGVVFSASALLLIILCFGFIAMLPTGKKFYFIFSVLTGAFGFCGFLFAELYDPVILFMDRRWIIGFGLFAASFLFFPRSFSSRAVFTILVLLQGEAIFAFSFLHLVGRPEAGTGAALDLAAFSLLVQASVHAAVRLAETAIGSNRHKLSK